MAKIIPVIHIQNEHQVLINIERCRVQGIKSFFLICHDYGFEAIDRLVNVASVVDMVFDDLWLGVNFLQLQNKGAVKKINDRDMRVDALWCDSGLIIGPGQYEEAKQLSEQLKAGKRSQNAIYFGGMDFKYQKAIRFQDRREVYAEAVKYIDVITTSGDGTGKAPTAVKLAAIREMIGSHPMAVASGASADNREMMEKYADYILVATSITDPDEYINPEKLKRFLGI